MENHEPISKREAMDTAYNVEIERQRRAEELESERMVRAERLASVAAVTEFTLKQHEEHLKAINSNIEHFAKALRDVEKIQIETNATANVEREHLSRRFTTATFILGSIVVLVNVLAFIIPLIP